MSRTSPSATLINPDKQARITTLPFPAQSQRSLQDAIPFHVQNRVSTWADFVTVFTVLRTSLQLNLEPNRMGNYIQEKARFQSGTGHRNPTLLRFASATQVMSQQADQFSSVDACHWCSVPITAAFEREIITRGGSAFLMASEYLSGGTYLLPQKYNITVDRVIDQVQYLSAVSTLSTMLRTNSLSLTRGMQTLQAMAIAQLQAYVPDCHNTKAAKALTMRALNNLNLATLSADARRLAEKYQIPLVA